MANVSQRDPNGGYIFSSSPRTVENRSKYRDDQNYGNIMHDPRVVRGNTYAQRLMPPSAQPDPREIQRQQEIKRKAIARKRALDEARARSPEAVLGRKHIVVQTDQYLEELSDILVTSQTGCQTDPDIDRPESPLFIPAKTGRDTETQIEEGELFDFDLEAQPVLQVLVGKTIEQSLLEVMEEEELAHVRAQLRAFQELRNNEMAEVQRLQKQEKRHRDEKERRIEQQKEVLKRERQAAEEVAAQQYLADLLPAIIISIRSFGLAYDPVKRDIESNFFPWLMAQVNETLEKRYAARMLLDSILRAVSEGRLEEFKELEG